MRNAVAARQFALRVPTHNPPATDLVIRAQAQEANAEALWNLVESGPISPKRVYAMPVRIPGIWVRSTPKGVIQLRTQQPVAGSRLSPR